jgi:hypothetical protein
MNLCVIIDASVAGLAFSVPPHADFAPVWHWIKNRGGKLVIAGRLSNELSGARRLISQLWKAGLALGPPKEEVDKEEQVVRKSAMCRSNDSHIIALARVSGARVLCTNDGDLEADFKNRELVPNPRGGIYKNASHKSLLKHNRICIGRPQ